MSQQLFNCADRIRNVPFSPMRVVLERAKELERHGNPVIYLQVGEPNFDTPIPIVDATIKALNDKYTKYGPNRGTISLRRAICKDIMSKNGLEYNPETEILVTVSGAEGINNSIMAFINPGDEVITFSPAYINYANVTEMARGTTVRVPLRKENNLQIDPAEFRKAITAKTKMVVINNPVNPTGIVYTPEVLAEVAKICLEHNLLVLSDEMYDEILYDGVCCKSIATYPGMRERTILLNGFSKTYAMTGWRLGYLASTPEIIIHLLKVHQYETTCPPTFIQEGTAAAMHLPETIQQKNEMIALFARRRSLLLNGLRSIPGLSFVEPKGAFYVMVDVSATGLTGAEFARRLLEEKYIAAVPGVGFAPECTDYIRLSFANSDENITAAIGRLQDFVAALK